METTDSPAPAAGVRVLDLSRLVAGNFATHVLADYGADVIKVERPGKGDDLRNWRVDGVDVYWQIYARNKRSICLDFSTADGRRTLLDLCRTAHVLVENFLPGTLEGWDIGPDRLLEANPRLVILRISGWGQTSMHRRRPGFGTLVEAMSGWAYLNGHPDKPPTLPPLALADMVSGLYGAASALAALRAVEMSGGSGQVLDLSLIEPVFSLISAEAAKVRLTGATTMRSGNQSSHTAPRNLYRCADGGFIALAGSMQSMAERIFDAIGRPELKTSEKFVTNDARVANRDELDAIIGEFVSRRTLAENIAHFEQANVTVGPVYSVAQFMQDPYAIERQAVVEPAGDGSGSIPMHNVIPRMRGVGGSFRAAPKLGEHTAQILAECPSAGQAAER